MRFWIAHFQSIELEEFFRKLTESEKARVEGAKGKEKGEGRRTSLSMRAPRFREPVVLACS